MSSPAPSPDTSTPWWRERLAELRAWAGPFARAHKKELAVAGLFLLVLLGPFLLRPSESTAPSRYDRRLVIMTPHHELIRQEFGRAFARWWKAKTGQVVNLDWRVSGTSELAMMIRSDFTSAYQLHWTRTLRKPWNDEVADKFLKPDTPADDPARAEFLKSEVGIGVDLFFGGGTQDFKGQASAGTIVARDPRTGAGLSRLMEKHPDWFGEAIIPASLSGSAFQDSQARWCGTAVSTFGIVFNRDVLQRLGITTDPTQWSDLADPRLYGQVAMADPNKSGSVSTAFEMLIQQQMQESLERHRKASDGLRKVEAVESDAVNEGWAEGFKLIQRISANARYFTDSSTKIPLDVTRGDAAAGMSIDFYGRSASEDVRRPDGSSRIGFVAPKGGTGVLVDPIAMMRGAPDPELAEAFMEFVLSEEGQKLWNYRAGTPGGPEQTSLRRLPIRRDLYTESHRQYMSDPGENPYEMAKAFTYRPEWTASSFSVIRFITRVLCVDPHRELRDTWHELIRMGLPPRAMEAFHGLQRVSYDSANGDLARMLSGHDKVREVLTARQLTKEFQAQYEKALNFARNPAKPRKEDKS